MARLLRLTILATIFVALAVGMSGSQRAEASGGFWWTTSNDQCLYLTDGSYSYAAICASGYALDVYFASDGDWYFQTSVTQYGAAQFMLATTTNTSTGYVGGANSNLEVVTIEINGADIAVDATAFDLVGYGFAQSVNNSHIDAFGKPVCYWYNDTCYYY